MPSNATKEPGRGTTKNCVEVVIPARPLKRVCIASPEVQPAPGQVEEVVLAPLASEADEQSPEHPYANAHDITYVPPVYNLTVMSKVVEHLLNLPVMITHHELLSPSPEVCSIYHEITSTC